MNAGSIRGPIARRQQQGATLIVAMGMLVVIGLMSASVMRGALSSDLVANNARAQNIAQQSAEIALRYCERVIQAVPSTVVIQAEHADGDGDPLTPAPTHWSEATSWSGVSKLATEVPAEIMASENSSFLPTVMPECMAEDITLEDGVTKAVMVTARGFSPDFDRDENGAAVSGSEVWLQSTIIFN